MSPGDVIGNTYLLSFGLQDIETCRFHVVLEMLNLMLKKGDFLFNAHNIRQWIKAWNKNIRLHTWAFGAI